MSEDDKDRASVSTYEINIPRLKIYISTIDRQDWCQASDTTERCFFCGGIFGVYEVMPLVEIDEGRNELSPGGVVCESCIKQTDKTLLSIILRQAEIHRINANIFGLVYSELQLWLDSESTDNHPMSDNLRYLRLEYQEKSFNADQYELLSTFVEIIRTETPTCIPGVIYLLGSPEGYCKIGRTKNLTQRLLQIGLQLPFRVEVIHSFKAKDCIAMERTLHRRFAHARKNGEWFLLSPKEIDWIRIFQDELN